MAPMCLLLSSNGGGGGGGVYSSRDGCYVWLTYVKPSKI